MFKKKITLKFQGRKKNLKLPKINLDSNRAFFLPLFLIQFIYTKCKALTVNKNYRMESSQYL